MGMPPLATEQNDGLLSADDKKILNNLNPNIEKTISNLNASEFNVINAKQEDALGLVIAVEPTVSQQIRTINLLDVSIYTPGFYIGVFIPQASILAQMDNFQIMLMTMQEILSQYLLVMTFIIQE